MPGITYSILFHKSNIFCTDMQEEELMTFHDAVEEVDDLSSDDENAMMNPSSDPRVQRLRSKISMLNRRRAAIRTKKVCGRIDLLECKEITSRQN